MGAPPFIAPGDQLMPIYEPEVISGKLIKLIGASGAVKSTAPLPAGDGSPLPTTLMAVT